MMLPIYGSLTSADPAALGEAAERLAAAGVDGLHLDIADGTFVPLITFGLPLVRAIRERLPTAVLDVHLMVERPEAWLDELAAAGATRVAFHVEATRYPWRMVTIARRAGIPTVGIALNPATPPSVLDAVAHEVGFVNLLTTEPDVAGERMLPGMPGRVLEVRGRLGAGARILVDGGVTSDNLAGLVGAGASEAVVGREITGSDDWQAALVRLREAVR